LSTWNDAGFNWSVFTAGQLRGSYRTGSDSRSVSSAAPGFVDGTSYDVKATFELVTGGWTFYKNGDEVSAHTGQATTPGSYSDRLLTIGALASNLGDRITGTVYEAIVRDGIDGPVVAHFDATEFWYFGDKEYVSFHDGRTWTPHGGVKSSSLATSPVASMRDLEALVVGDPAQGIYLPYSGGVMTGLLVLNQDPSSSLDAATKGYADSRDALYLPLSGGTLTGNLDMDGNDLSGIINIYGDAGSGIALRPAASRNTSLYDGGGTLRQIIHDGAAMLWYDQAGTQLVRVTNGTVDIYGPLNMQSQKVNSVLNPTDPQDAATKDYVDGLTGGSINHNNLTNVTADQHHVKYTNGEAVTANLGLWLSLGGGNLTGVINMGGNRIESVGNANSDDDAVSRGYADARYLELTGGTVTGVLSIDSTGIAYPGVTHGGGTANAIGFKWGGIGPNKVNVVVDNVLAYAIADYADLALYLPLTGGTVTGDLTISDGHFSQQQQSSVVGIQTIEDEFQILGFGNLPVFSVHDGGGAALQTVRIYNPPASTQPPNVYMDANGIIHRTSG